MIVSIVRHSLPQALLVIFETEIAVDINDISAAKNIICYFYDSQMPFSLHATLIAAIHFVLAQVSSPFSFYSGKAIFAKMLNIC